MPKGCHNNHASSANCHRWSSEKIFTTAGYVKIRVGKEHPLADPNGYAYEHLVVWVSAANERPSNGFILHHTNGYKDDNRLENLELMSRAEHNRLHNKDKVRDETGRFVGKHAAGRLLDGREWNELPLTS